jgi:hypothetical protein
MPRHERTKTTGLRMLVQSWRVRLAKRKKPLNAAFSHLFELYPWPLSVALLST